MFTRMFSKHSAAMVAAILLVMAAPAAAILQKGQNAPPIKVVSTSGQQITLANYRGYVLIVDFFASWCIPCREAVPHLAELNAKYGSKGLQILGLSVDEEGDLAVKAFISDRKVPYPVAFANEDQQADYGLRSVPTMFLINKKGVVVEKYMGYSPEMRKSLETNIKKLLAE